MLALAKEFSVVSFMHAVSKSMLYTDINVVCRKIPASYALSLGTVLGWICA